MSAMNIFLTIHATSRWNELHQTQGHCDAELSVAGSKMSLLLAERQDLADIKAIYTSDLKRAYQTAEPLSDKLGIPIMKSALLREGNWAHYHRDPAYPPLPSDGPFEDKDALTTRAINSMAGIATSEHRSPILIVAHGAFVRCFLSHTFPAASSEYKGIRTAINHLQYVDDHWHIISLNDDAHLRELHSADTTLDNG